MQDAIYTLAHYLVELTKLFLFVFAILRCEYKSGKRICEVYILGGVVFVILDFILRLIPMWTVMSGIFVMFSISLMLNRKRDIPIVIAGFLGISLFDGVVATVACAIGGININILSNNQGISQNINNLSMFVLLFVAFVIRIIRGKQKDSIKLELKDNILKNILCLSIIICVMGYFMAIAEENILTHGRMRLPQLIGIVAMLILFLGGCAFCIYWMKRWADEQGQLEEYAGLINKQQGYYERALSKEEKTKQFRHDMKAHMNILSTLVQKKEYDRAEEYLSNISGKLEGKKLHLTNNVLIDIILDDVVAQFQDVKFTCHGVIPELSGMSDVDVGTLFHNLFLNAVEAANNSDEKSVHLEVITITPNLLIQETNSYSGKIEMKQGVLQSTKENKTMHGFGVKNMTEIVEKYGGEIKFYPEEQFTIKIVLENIL